MTTWTTGSKRSASPPGGTNDVTNNRYMQSRRWQRKGTSLAGLLAMAVHLAAFALGAIMPVATALAEAQADPFEIVICTVHGPVTVDARELGIDTDSEAPAKMPRGACALSLQATAAVAIETPPGLLVLPVVYDPQPVMAVVNTRTAYTPPHLRGSAPRGPPHTS